jgi:hypothetical protein
MSRQREGVDAALSPARVVGFVEQWPYLQETGLSVEGCEVRRARRSADGVVELEYRFSLHRPGTADQFMATFLGRRYADDRGESDYRELLASRSGKEHLFSDANLQGFALYVPELRLLLHASLEDERLPGLQTALAPEAMQPLLDELSAFSSQPAALADRRPRIAHDSSRLCEVGVLHYKPGKRCTLRYRLESRNDPESSGRTRSFIGKMYRDGEAGERVFATMQELDRRGFGRDATDGVRTPQPFGYLHDLQMVVMEELPGAPLSETLSAPGLDESLAMAARAAAKIHRCPLQIGREADETPADWIRSLKRGVSEAIRVDPNLTARLEAGLRLIEDLARELPAPAATLVHGGFYLREVLVGRHGVALVDMDKFHNADPARDVGNFIADLRWHGLQLGWSEEKARSSRQMFLSAYVQAFISGADLQAGVSQPSSPTWRSALLGKRIDFYSRVFLLRRACRVAQRPKSQALMGSLIAEVFKA